MAFDKTKFIGKFVEEARDHISKINDGLLGLEETPDNMEILNQIFRSAHTIKGSSRILSVKPVTDLTHQMENALDELRNSKIQTSAELFTLLFSATDKVGHMVDELQKSGEIESDGKLICENLERAVKGEAFQAEPGVEKKSTPESFRAPKAKKKPVKQKDSQEKKDSSSEKAPETVPMQEVKELVKSKVPVAADTVRVDTDKLDSTIKVMGEIMSNQSRLKHGLADLNEINRISQSCLDLINKSIEHGTSGNGEGRKMAMAAHDLQTKIKQLSLNTRDALNIHDLLTDDLREKVLKMRMLSLSTVLNSFPRLVRDIATSSGKKIDFIVEGAETELDKKVIEKIGDPLLHMVRNCVDHGIESPKDRLKAGKPEKGTVRFSAGYEGGHVLIEVMDDGSGIPLEKIKDKARARKMFADKALNEMSETEITNLIFHPGFSTSPIITDISGRGVGMDVAKECIVEQLKGSIQVESKPDQYTRFVIRVPLTLAILGVLQVTLGDDLFAFPLSSITEIIKIPREEILDVVNQRAIRLREQIIPVVELKEILNSPGEKEFPQKEVLIILLVMGSEKLGVIVDSLVSEENVEVKPLPSHMKSIELVSGASISGKNEIIILLHVPRIFELAKQAKEGKHVDKFHKEEEKANYILVVDDSVNTREIEKSILESYGYNVDTASDGMEAMEMVKEFKYDLIVTDVEMPRMDGFTLCEELRKDSRYKLVPVVIVTSRDKPEDKRRGVKVGANAYIVKGDFNQSNLLDTVESLIV
ncbi:MAG: hybrid sensor histidine kinase/response regulator [Nitrospina sp.]|nr:hybrid sensor histidine kinase/response regulator [Nitrospina sp.]